MMIKKVKKMPDGQISFKGNSRTCVTIKGEYAIHQVMISFLEDCDTANFMTKFDNFIFDDETIPLLKDAILHINSKLLIGHFDLIDEGKKYVVFSISQPFVREMNIDASFFSKIVDMMTGTLNTFYPCFEAIQRREIDNVNAIDLWAMEPQCEA